VDHETAYTLADAAFDGVKDDDTTHPWPAATRSALATAFDSGTRTVGGYLAGRRRADRGET
jgi:hypothetical protein